MGNLHSSVPYPSLVSSLYLVHSLFPLFPSSPSPDPFPNSPGLFNSSSPLFPTPLFLWASFKPNQFSQDSIQSQ